MIHESKDLNDIVNILSNEKGFLRDGYGHMWKIENNKIFYKPQDINIFFEVRIKGRWFRDPIEVMDTTYPSNYK